MKQFLILFLALFTAGQLCSQELGTLVIEPVECDNIIYRECHPRNGVIVFYSASSDLEFDLSQTPDRLINEPYYDARGSQYVLCVQPTDKFAGGITQYAIDVMAKGYKPEILFVSKINPGQAQCFKVTKVDPNKKGPKPQVDGVTKVSTSDNLPQWNMSLGGGVNVLGDANFGVVNFGIGVFTNPNSLLSFEVGIGTGSYTEYDFTKYMDADFTGNINYSYGKTLLLLGSWSYVTGDKSNSFQWRIGPSVGMLGVSGYFDYNGISGTPPDKNSISKQAFVIGVSTGVTWNIGNVFFDLSYRPYYHTAINFGESAAVLDQGAIIVQEKDFSSIGNQVNLSFGIRFGDKLKKTK